MKIFNLPWAYLHRNLSGKYRVSPLLNDCASFDYLKSVRDVRKPDGVYFKLSGQHDRQNIVSVPLIFTDPALLDLSLPNGKYKEKYFDSLSYVTNEVVRQDGSPWSTPPAGLPKSETEGANFLSPMGNTFANVPSQPARYVTRAGLEKRLVQELQKPERHPIISLKGPGGIGKTTIAIQAVRQISGQDQPPYEIILWISARDIDLLDSGPKSVSRRVFTKRDISRAVVDLLGPEEKSEPEFNPDFFLQKCFADGAAGSTLFIFDNFETLQNPSDVVEWIDTHIRPPNKVLITTRLRDFLGDYPIEIGGMSDDEAYSLIEQHASWLSIEEFLSTDYREKLIRESDGHPYVIKILLGQVAKEKQAVDPKRIFAASDYLLDALFKRTYDALGADPESLNLW